MPYRFSVRSSIVVASIVVAVSSACVSTSGDSARRGFLEEVLEQRAGILDAEIREAIAKALVEAERRHGVDAFLLAAVAEQESHFRPGVTSRRGARGLMQIRPPTAAGVAARHGIPWSGPDDLFDPGVAIAVGAAYLAELEREFGSWESALIAYHRGPTRLRALERRGRSPDSRYARRVLQRQRQLDQRFHGVEE